MKPDMTRRSLLGAALVLPFIPGLSLGQTTVDQKEVLMQIRVTFGPEAFTVTLFDNVSSRELAAILPLDLTIEDFGGTRRSSTCRASCRTSSAARSLMLLPVTSASTSRGVTWPSSMAATRARATWCGWAGLTAP